VRSGLLAAAVVLVGTFAAYSGEEQVPLKNAPGHDVGENNCAASFRLPWSVTVAIRRLPVAGSVPSE